MFRSKSKSKSLKVQRETIRVLAGSQLTFAQGGTLTPGTIQVVTYREGQNGCSPQIGGGNGSSESNLFIGCEGGILETSGLINPRPIIGRP
jgi:hypothetical protein